MPIFLNLSYFKASLAARSRDVTAHLIGELTYLVVTFWVVLSQYTLQGSPLPLLKMEHVTEDIAWTDVRCLLFHGNKY